MLPPSKNTPGNFDRPLLTIFRTNFFEIAESRLGPEVADGHVSIPGCGTIQQGRNLSDGGVLLYIKDNLKARVLHASKTIQLGKPMKPEYLFCEV